MTLICFKLFSPIRAFQDSLRSWQFCGRSIKIKFFLPIPLAALPLRAPTKPPPTQATFKTVKIRTDFDHRPYSKLTEATRKLVRCGF